MPTTSRRSKLTVGSSSSGLSHRRPVVATSALPAGEAAPIEITLTRRDERGFRMLIGRQAMRRRFVVDPARSLLAGQPDAPIRRRNRVIT